MSKHDQINPSIRHGRNSCTLSIILMSHFCSRALVFLSSNCSAFLIPARSFFVLDMARPSRYSFTWETIKLLQIFHTCRYTCLGIVIVYKREGIAWVRGHTIEQTEGPVFMDRQHAWFKIARNVWRGLLCAIYVHVQL